MLVGSKLSMSVKPVRLGRPLTRADPADKEGEKGGSSAVSMVIVILGSQQVC